MKKILISICIIITFYCNNIYALECNSSDKERLQKLANNVSYVLEEVDDDENISFKVTFTGVSKELMIVSSSYEVYSGSGFEYETVIPHLNQNSTYIFSIKSLSNCFNTTFRNITISLPKYNKYYEDKICDNAREFNLCQKWVNTDGISYDKFMNKVNNYISNKKIDNGIVDTEADDNYFDFNFGKFYRLVYFPSLLITILLIILLIIFSNKENKKNRL